MKSGVSPQKLRKYRRQTPIWASICSPVAPSLLISSGHSPRLGGHKQSFGGHGPGMPSRGAGPASIDTKTVKFYPQLFEISLFEHRQFFTICSFSYAKHRGT